MEHLAATTHLVDGFLLLRFLDHLVRGLGVEPGGDLLCEGGVVVKLGRQVGVDVVMVVVVCVVGPVEEVGVDAELGDEV